MPDQLRRATGAATGGSTATAIDMHAVAALADEIIGPQHKGWPPATWGRTVAEVVAERHPLSAFPTPLVTLTDPAMVHNTEVLAGWSSRHGFALAPHGKTTMAPQLWQRQLDSGAWGITLANLAQLAVARRFGVRRVLIANEVLSPLGLGWIAGELAADPGLEVIVWADSIAGVSIMEDALSAADATSSPGSRPLDVMVELGGLGGRTGARTLDEAVVVAEEIATAPHLRLVGSAGYEGALADGDFADGVGTVRGYLEDLARLHELLLERGLVDDLAGPPFVSAGGSAYPDVVAEVLQPLTGSASVLIRSGAYLTHDDGYYRHISPWGESPRTDGAPLRPAMYGWVRVSSVPEPGMAIFDAGKRDLPYDKGLPEVQLLRARVVGGPASVLDGIEVTALNDQHGFLRYDPASSPVRVGDELRVGVSHPCTTFDKWTLLPVIDDADTPEPVVVDAIRTFF